MLSLGSCEVTLSWGERYFKSTKKDKEV